MRRASKFITITSAIISVVSLIAIILIETEYLPIKTGKSLYLNLANALFQVFLGVIVVNLLIEKALDREKRQLDHLERKREEEQKRIEKEQWNNTIQPFLMQEILNTVIAAFNTLDSTYKVVDDKLFIQWEDTDVHILKRNILRFRREKQNYLMYLGWFIDKMSLAQMMLYHKFEGKFDTLDYWLQDVGDNQNNIDWHRMIRANISIGLILEFVNQFMSDEQSRLLQKVATETLGTKKQLEHIFRKYQSDLHYIEVEDLANEDKKGERQWKLTYSIGNFFRAQKIYEEYTKALNASTSRKN